MVISCCIQMFKGCPQAVHSLVVSLQSVKVCLQSFGLLGRTVGLHTFKHISANGCIAAVSERVILIVPLSDDFKKEVVKFNKSVGFRGINQ